MPENDLALLDGADFDLPMTDAFVERVRREVRRRQARRAAVGVAGIAAAVVATVTLSMPAEQKPTAEPQAAASAETVDGFQVGYLPDQVRVGQSDSTATYAVTENHLRNDGPAPSPGEPTAAVTMRWYVCGQKPGGWLWISVLRPERTTPAVDRARITQWLLASQIGRGEAGEPYVVAAGTARLVTHRGVEGPIHDVLITTPDGVVITVSGRTEVPVSDLTDVAAGLG